MLTLVSGGSASGKSEFAESLVVSSPCTQRFYLATMIAFDEECRRRIARHRRMRAEKNFETIEIPTGLETIVFPQEDGVRFSPKPMCSARMYVKPCGKRVFFRQAAIDRGL